MHVRVQVLGWRSEQVKSLKNLEAWIKKHVVKRHYHVIIKKCLPADACATCKPPRMDEETFQELHDRRNLVPDPEPSRIPGASPRPAALH